MRSLAAANPKPAGCIAIFARLRPSLGFPLWLVSLPRDCQRSVAALARASANTARRPSNFSRGQTFSAVVMIGIVTAVNVWGTRKSSDSPELDHTRQDGCHIILMRPAYWSCHNYGQSLRVA